MMAIRVAAEPGAARAVALPVLAGAGGPGLPPTAYDLPEDARAEAAELLGDLDGEAGATRVLRRPLRTPGHLLLVPAGSGDEAGWRAAGAAVSRAFEDETSITVAMPVDASPVAVRGLAEGLLLAAYRFSMRDEPAAERDVTVVVGDPAAYAEALATARATADATRLARDLTNTPSSLKNPAWFAAQVVAAAGGRPGLRVAVREPEQLTAEGFGGILTVGAGSASPPRLVELSWQPEGARTHVVLVGKGITFDTGGVSIKPVDAMKLMRKDMGGAAAVVGATLGAAALHLPVRVTALTPLAENLLSGSAFRPGDVVRHYGGVTSETTNSDAEGRLVLADALAYAVARLSPDLVVDLATLTGANAVALGKRTAALYSESDDLAAAVIAAGAEAGEQAWRMPLTADYVEYLGSEVADLYSAPDRGAGSVTAALFLREFVGDWRDRWVHLDMSAPSWSDSADGVLPKGATGWGVRTLLRWLATLPAEPAPRRA
ncbi:leucyl aminopeptidase family protein [Phytohabitans sp. ZYX-F-186]|uniref:Probable cytosol aminopeptidase n=1 Tax=Phytohabitans maris TaxID=3071409 RepID=A0ABU0ZI84_9ACTN|nr:leucyl aminopeptidase family protein [Phytohabitans sp. ZYX-F-186]MDQ7906769.1 leucyl aminopeptidase family protein [Phytohabitans sp. ZYX-F-186]